jgi:hypothetical protein
LSTFVAPWVDKRRSETGEVQLASVEPMLAELAAHGVGGKRWAVDEGG